VRAYRRRQPTTREIGLVLGAALTGAVILAALTAANTRWSQLLPGGCGFYSVWAGAREFLYEHGDPYGASAAAHAHELAYGASADPLQNPCRLDLPFFLVPLYFPLAWIADPNVARGVWATLCQMGTVGATFLAMHLLEWHPPRGSLLLLCLIALLSVQTVAALIDGTPVVMLVFLYMSILWAIQNGPDELAGGLTVLALCKWEVGLPFLVFVALLVIQSRRWRIAAGFGMSLTILLGLAFLLYPGWFTPFLVGTVAEMRSAAGISTQSVLANIFPAAATKLALAIAAATLTLLILEVLGGRNSGFRHFSWSACLALAATPLLGMRSEISNLVVLVPGLVMIAAGGSDRRSRAGWITFCLLAALFGLPWIVSSALAADPAAQSTGLAFLAVPVVAILGMYWTRWWVLRPGRTWLDEIRAARRS
jgi:hypothetical protein